MVGWDLEYLEDDEDESIKQYYSAYLVYFGFVSKGYPTRTRKSSGCKPFLGSLSSLFPTLD
jgi:hypothetical protein